MIHPDAMRNTQTHQENAREAERFDRTTAKPRNSSWPAQKAGTKVFSGSNRRRGEAQCRSGAKHFLSDGVVAKGDQWRRFRHRGRGATYGAYDSYGDCGFVRERIETPSGRVIIKTRRSC